MGPLDLLFHLTGFVAPAAFLALTLPLAARLLLPRARQGRYWRVAALNFAVGLTVLGSGLAWFGGDGRMATYAALVVVMATAQWLALRGWRR